jgi:hypothetical protein
MNRGITPKSSAPRYALKAPDREVAFRLEHLATEKSRSSRQERPLYFRPVAVNAGEPSLSEILYA